MIILGIVLLLVAYLLPDLVPDVPGGILHVCSVLGTVAIIIGIILLFLGLVGRPLGGGWGPQVNGRRYWW